MSSTRPVASPGGHCCPQSWITRLGRLLGELLLQFHQFLKAKVFSQRHSAILSGRLSQRNFSASFSGLPKLALREKSRLTSQDISSNSLTTFVLHMPSKHTAASNCSTSFNPDSRVVRVAIIQDSRYLKHIGTTKHLWGKWTEHLWNKRSQKAKSRATFPSLGSRRRRA